MSTTNNFYLSELDISVNADKLTIPGGSDTTSFTADCYTTLECNVLYAQRLLQFQTDAIDMNDLNEEDLMFRVFHADSSTAGGTDLAGDANFKYFNSYNVMVANAVVNADGGNGKVFYGSSVETGDNFHNAHADFLRYVSEELFGVTAGVDLFNNVNAVRLDILEQSVNNYVTNIKSLSTPVTWNVAGDNPAALAFKQLIKNFPSRFTNLDAYKHSYTDASATLTAGASTEKVWYYMPFAADDKIYFKLTLNAATDQGDIVNSSSIEPRTYSICLKLVGNDPASTDDNYHPTWTGDVRVFTSEPAYLQPTDNDTVEP